jgi:histidyl-tRNA synthetase
MTVIAGPDERERGEVTMRDLLTGDPRTAPRREIVELVRQAGS